MGVPPFALSLSKGPSPRRSAPFRVIPAKAGIQKGGAVGPFTAPYHSPIGAFCFNLLGPLR